MEKKRDFRFEVGQAKRRFIVGEISNSEMMDIVKQICKDIEIAQIKRFGKVRQKFTPSYLLR